MGHSLFLLGFDGLLHEQGLGLVGFEWGNRTDQSGERLSNACSAPMVVPWNPIREATLRSRFRIEYDFLLGL